jgi:hypothetical protein
MIASRTGERVREPASERSGGEWIQAARRPRGWKRELAVAAAVGAFLGVIGPFGSYSSGPMGPRIAYWIACVVLGTLVFGTAVRIVASRRLGRGRALAAAVALAALLGIPFSLLVALPARALWPPTAEIPPLHWYLQVLTVAAPLCAGWILLERRSGREPPPRRDSGSNRCRSEPSRGPSCASRWRIIMCVCIMRLDRSWCS